MVLESVECTNLLVPLQMTPIRLLPPRRGLDIGAFGVWKYGNQLSLSHTKSKLLNHPAVLFVVHPMQSSCSYMEFSVAVHGQRYD